MPIEHAESPNEFLAPAEAAAIIGVHRDTLKRYEDRDQLITSVRTPSGHRRYRRSDVEALLTSKAAQRASA